MLIQDDKIYEAFLAVLEAHGVENTNVANRKFLLAICGNDLEKQKKYGLIDGYILR